MAQRGLTVNNLTLNFGAVRAVDRVSFQVRDGEFVTLLGSSVCGKTTILRMIAGFLEPDAGEIFYDGKPVSALPPNRRPTAMVFQSYALFPHKTVGENVRFGLRMQKVPIDQQDRRIREVLDIVHLEGMEERKPSNCRAASSSGSSKSPQSTSPTTRVRPWPYPTGSSS